MHIYQVSKSELDDVTEGHARSTYEGEFLLTCGAEILRRLENLPEGEALIITWAGESD